MAEHLHVLYVEDDPAHASLARRHLARAGIGATVVPDAPSGLAACDAGAFDAVLVDQALPGEDGLAFVRRLSARGPLPPVLVVTGAGDERVAVEAMRLGVEDYVVKDLAGTYLEMLPALVERAVQRHRLRGEKQAAEVALLASEARYRTLLEQLPDGFVMVEQTDTGRVRVVDVNAAAVSLLGVGSERVLGAEVDVLLPESGPRLTELLAQVASTRTGSLVLDRYLPELDRHLRISMTTPEPGRIALLLSDVSDRVQLARDLERLAHTDPLTGLLNHRQLFVQADTELRRLRRYGRPVSLLMIDLDHFKRINDEFGHLLGDRVLVLVAEVMRRSLRDVDLVGRFGGEEFAVLLPETTLDEAGESAERLRVAIAASPLPLDGSHISVSVGVAEARDDETLDGLVDRADQALYAAKAAGRDCVRVAAG